MSGQTFALLENKESQEQEWVEVDGTPVIVVTGYETFMYSDEDQDIEKNDAPFDVYHVIHVKSGVAFGRGFDRQMAIESAQMNIRTIGKQRVDRMVREAIQKYGLSPACSGECYDIKSVQGSVGNEAVDHHGSETSAE